MRASAASLCRRGRSRSSTGAAAASRCAPAGGRSAACRRRSPSSGRARCPSAADLALRGVDLVLQAVQARVRRGAGAAQGQDRPQEQGQGDAREGAEERASPGTEVSGERGHASCDAWPPPPHDAPGGGRTQVCQNGCTMARPTSFGKDTGLQVRMFLTMFLLGVVYVVLIGVAVRLRRERRSRSPSSPAGSWRCSSSRRTSSRCGRWAPARSRRRRRRSCTR